MRIFRSARDPCACLRLCHRPGARALAAGVTWTSRTLAAEWGGRRHHTTVIDAAGAIYVIGGTGSGPDYNDVWSSTDGGARPYSVGGWSGGTPGGCTQGTTGYCRVSIRVLHS